MERDIQDLLMNEDMTMKKEVKTPSGYIDLMDTYRIYEIKEFSKWKSAIGQILSYSIHYPEKQRCIWLFGNYTEENVFICEQVCKQYDIEVVIHEKIIKELLVDKVNSLSHKIRKICQNQIK